MNKRGNVLVGALFLVAFVALVSVPVVQVVNREHTASIKQQCNIAALGYAEAGLRYAEAAIRSGSSLPFTSGVQQIGAGSFEVISVEKQIGNYTPGADPNDVATFTYLVSRGILGSATRVVQEEVQPALFSEVGALTLTSTTDSLYVKKDGATLDVTGDVRMNAGLIAADDQKKDEQKVPTLDVSGTLVMSGEFWDEWQYYSDDKAAKPYIGGSTVEGAPNFHTDALQLWVDAYCSTFEPATDYGDVTIPNLPDDPDSGPNIFILEDGAVHYWSTNSDEDKEDMQNLIIIGRGGTLIVEGPLYFKEMSGTMDLFVLDSATEEAKIEQYTGGGTEQGVIDITGLIYCEGNLDVDVLKVSGAVVAETLTLPPNFQLASITYNAGALPFDPDKMDEYTFFTNWSETTWP